MTTEATVKVHVGGERVIATAEGNGPVNALDRALRTALNGSFPALERVHLTDYKVRVLDTQKGTGAVTRVLIDSTDGDADLDHDRREREHHRSVVAGAARLDPLRPAPGRGVDGLSPRTNRRGRADRSVRSVRSRRPAAPAAEPAAGRRRCRPRATGAPTARATSRRGQPSGALLGTPGPNVGYAYTLAERVADRLRLGPHEHADDVDRGDRRDRGQARRAVRPGAGDRRHRRRDRSCSATTAAPTTQFVEIRAAARARSRPQLQPPARDRRRRARGSCCGCRPDELGERVDEWRRSCTRTSSSRARPLDRLDGADARDRLRLVRRVRGAAGIGAPSRRGAHRAERGRGRRGRGVSVGELGGVARRGLRRACRSRRQYGGQDGGVLAHAIAVEEVARVCASSSLFTFISKLGDDAGARPRIASTLKQTVRRAGRGGRVPGVVLPLGGRRRQRRRRACGPGPSATATTTCSPAASSGSRTRA